MVKTLVYQSYRTTDVPDWMLACMASVRQWAGDRGFDYRFVGDEILALVPDWFAAKALGRKQIITDLGRLLLARRYLAEGYGRVVWLDADVLIFDPGNLRLEPGGKYAFGREVWIQQDGKAGLRAFINIHNAVSVFDIGNSFLEFYIEACLSILGRVEGGVPPQIIGPKFLKAIHNIAGFELLHGVGSLSPLLMDAVLSSEHREDVLARFRRESEGRVCAVNLCASLVGGVTGEITVSEEMMDEVCTRLIDTGGVVLNSA